MTRINKRHDNRHTRKLFELVIKLVLAFELVIKLVLVFELVIDSLSLVLWKYRSVEWQHKPAF